MSFWECLEMIVEAAIIIGLWGLVMGTGRTEKVWDDDGQEDE